MKGRVKFAFLAFKKVFIYPKRAHILVLIENKLYLCYR